MNDELYFDEASALLTQYTQIEGPWIAAKVILKNKLLYLLENDLPALYQLLYRIDVDEKKARLAFGGDANTIAENLLELIVQRILQKAKSRVDYKERK